MRPKSIPRHAYLDKNSQRSRGRLRRDLFAAGAAKCLSMLPVHLQQFAALRVRSPPICSAANKHFMCHRGPCHTPLHSVHLLFCFCCRRPKCARRRSAFRAIALQTTFEACQCSPSDTARAILCFISGSFKVSRLIEGFFF